jgi:hypothetical protein
VQLALGDGLPAHEAGEAASDTDVSAKLCVASSVRAVTLIGRELHWY